MPDKPSGEETESRLTFPSMDSHPLSSLLQPGSLPAEPAQGAPLPSPRWCWVQ